MSDEPTSRAGATRTKLLAAARRVFEADGYDGASISRIVEQAEVARGTFYLYFDSKEAVVRALASELTFEVVELQRTPGDTGTPLDNLSDLIARYVAYYREHAVFMAVLEQVATHDEGFRALRRDMRRGVAVAAIAFVERQQDLGTVPRTVAARPAGVALTGMVDRFLYVWLVLGERFDEDEVVTTLSRLWWQAIGGTVDADR
ncbi:MAG: TetR/AcrR family transcriptional regulator [Desertimonas sp.]